MKTRSLLKKLGMLIMCLTVYININATCPSYHTLPFEETFMPSFDFAPCWTTRVEGYNKWLSTTSNGIPCISVSGEGDDQGWLISPLISLPANSTINLDFMSSFIHILGVCRVNISTDSNNPGDGKFTEVWKMTANEKSMDFIPINIDLSAYAGKNIYVGFEFINNVIGSWFIKDFKVHSTATSIQDVEAQGKTIHIYPNPVIEIMNIESPEDILKLEIMNMEGKKIQEIENPGNSIDLSYLPQGVYIIKITTENGLVTKRIIKQ